MYLGGVSCSHKQIGTADMLVRSNMNNVEKLGTEEEDCDNFSKEDHFTLYYTRKKVRDH